MCFLVNEGKLTTPSISRTNNLGCVASASSLLTTVSKTQNFAIQNTELTVKGESFFRRKWPQEDHQIPQRAMESFFCVLFETKLICRVICQVEVNILTGICRLFLSCVLTIQVQPSYPGRAMPDKYHVCPDFCMNVSKTIIVNRYSLESFKIRMHLYMSSSRTIMYTTILYHIEFLMDTQHG